MLELSDVTIRYGQHLAADRVSATVAAGETVVILGANGAGKTSLLKAISGIIAAQPGSAIRFQDRDVTGTPAHEITGAGIALVPEGRGLFGGMTVRDNLRLGANPARARAVETERLELVHDLFPRLAERQGQIVRTMSGGEQQMVAVGRAMMSNPAILALDEPSLGLSPLLCKDLFHSLLTVKEAGIGILLVEQNAKQSLRVADRGYLLENATIVHE
ncbi:MAG: ABC transporter ATP-binding protein, partial [Roseicyclus sp.]|nr:ABC transporter ATP-binding protein [Roseicyclus sp.]